MIQKIRGVFLTLETEIRWRMERRGLLWVVVGRVAAALAGA